MRTVRYLGSILIGLVFFLSALSKLIDPVGTGLIVSAYFNFFHLTFLSPAAKAAGVAISFCEAVTSVALLSGFKRVLFARITLAFITFFTLISSILLVFNPDMDCGCFGQIVHLTHWQTFLKNLILFLVALICFLPMREIQLLRERKVAFFTGVVIFAAFTVITCRNLPFVEYTPYSVSHTIVGESELTDDDNNVALSIWNSNSEDCSDLILYDKVALISVYRPEKLSESQINDIAMFAQDAQNSMFQPVLVSVSDISVPGLETFFADYKTLISLNRGNPGITFLENGFIFRKENRLDKLSFEEMDKMNSSESTEIYIKAATGHSLRLQLFVLGFLALMMIL